MMAFALKNVATRAGTFIETTSNVVDDIPSMPLPTRINASDVLQAHRRHVDGDALSPYASLQARYWRFPLGLRAPPAHPQGRTVRREFLDQRS